MWSLNTSMNIMGGVVWFSVVTRLYISVLQHITARLVVRKKSTTVTERFACSLKMFHCEICSE